MDKNTEILDELVREALKLGASDARIITVESIRVEERLAVMCRTPQCDGYGQSVNCPPYVLKPLGFKELLKRYQYALVFKIDVATQMLLGEDRDIVASRIHKITSSVEQFAIARGYLNSKGLAAGSCKRIFCSKDAGCSVLDENGVCRFPDIARPSMSGLGINFFELSQLLGWQINNITKDTDPDKVPMGMMAGMVLIGTIQNCVHSPGEC